MNACALKTGKDQKIPEISKKKNGCRIESIHSDEKNDSDAHWVVVTLCAEASTSEFIHFVTQTPI